MLLFADFTSLLKNIDASRIRISWFFGCKPKKDIGIQNSMYMTQKNPLCKHFICLSLNNHSASILLALTLEIVMTPNASIQTKIQKSNLSL